MEDSVEKPQPSGITRRRLFELGGTAAAGAAANEIARKIGYPHIDMRPEHARNHPTEYGFTQHLFVDDEHPNSQGRNQDLELFKKSVDILSRNGQEWVRFNIWDWEIGSFSESGHVQWNEENAEAYREALEYVREKGLQACVVANTPYEFRGMPDAEYERLTGAYFGHLAQEYKGLVSEWQVFNEADIHDYHDYSMMDRPGFHGSQEWYDYIQRFSRTVRSASQAIRQADPETQISVNMAAAWHGSSERQRVAEFFDPIAPYVDELMLSYYPYKSTMEIAEMAGNVATYADRYPAHKISVGEIGMSTGVYDVDSADQKRYMTRAVRALKSGSRPPDKILVFSLTDRVGEGPVESQYGLLDADGNDKGAFKQVVELMQ